MSRAIDCNLIPENNNSSAVTIPDGEEVILGRNQLSKVRGNKLCSRKQIVLKGNYEKSEITAKCIGRYLVSVDGKLLCRGTEYILKNGSLIKLGSSYLKYRVKFKYDDNDNTTTTPKRRKHGSAKHIKLEDNAWSDFFDKKLIVYTSPDFIHVSKIASFDLDSTIIKNTFFSDGTFEWKFWNPIVKETLRNLYKDGFMIVIFTNQAGLSPSKGDANLPSFKAKIEAVVSQIEVPMKVLISTTHGLFRKPAPGMWNFLINNAPCFIDKRASFYVGDAAGRIDNWKAGAKKDFALSDRLFAENLNIEFFTPDEYFLNEPRAPFRPVPLQPGELCLTVEPNYKVPSFEQEVIIMVGTHSTGKTTFVKKMLTPHSYMHIASDYVETLKESLSILKEALAHGNSVVIDYTNHSVETRRNYISVCKRFSVRIRCFVMDCSLERALHNNTFRLITNPEYNTPATAVRRIYDKCQTPNYDEGFSEILYVPFIINLRNFKDADRRMYLIHLVSSF